MASAGMGVKVGVGPSVGGRVAVGGGVSVGGKNVAVIRIGIGVKGGKGFKGVVGLTKMMLNTIISAIEATKNRIAIRLGNKVLRGCGMSRVGA